VAISYLAELLRDYTPVRTFRSSDFLSLAVPTFIFKTIVDRSFCSSGPRACNSLPSSLRAGTLACTDAIPGTVSAMLCCYLLAIHFDGLSEFCSLPATTVMSSMRKHADSSGGSVNSAQPL